MKPVSRKDKWLDFFMAKAKSVDYAFKSYVLREHSELISKYKKAKRYDFAVNRYINEGIKSKILDNSDNISIAELQNDCLYNDLGKEFHEITKIEHASFTRATRLKNRIETMLLNGDCLFLTLTFNDNTLQNTTAKQRRTAVVRYLKQFNCQYVANIDFGADNGREHYHSVINISKIDLTGWRKYGNINVERIRNKGIELAKVRLSKYISKLSNHAIKETTRRTSLIYSR